MEKEERREITKRTNCLEVILIFENSACEKSNEMNDLLINYNFCRMQYRQFNEQNVSPIQTESKSTKIVDFDNWLENLDHILHEKYLKERRFQVRSFYCQPTYYGTAAIR